jgi:hypothetical protein
MVTRGDFARGLLHRLDYPETIHNLNALVSWMTAEGGPSLDGSFNPPQARFNPLNTTKTMFGSTDFNSVHVQNYQDLNQGLDATVATLQEHGHEYGPIRRHLRNNSLADKTLRAVEASEWGTGGLAREVLPGVQKHFDSYADKPIGQ